MNKKSKIIVLISVLLAVAVIAAAVVIIFVVKGSNAAEIIPEEIENAWVASAEYEENSFMNMLDERSSFTIDDIQEEEDDVYKVTCTVSAPDIKDALDEYAKSVSGIPDDKEINESISQMLETAPIKETSQSVTVFKTDDGFSVEFSDDFVDAMCGYSYKFCKAQMNELTESEG